MFVRFPGLLHLKYLPSSLLINPFFFSLISAEIYIFFRAKAVTNGVIEYKWQWRKWEAFCRRSHLVFSFTLMLSSKHTRNDGNMSWQAIAFLRFLIRIFFVFFFINCRFSSSSKQNTNTMRREKVSIWLVKAKVFRFLRCQKVLFETAWLMSPLDDHLIFSLFS